LVWFPGYWTLVSWLKFWTFSHYNWFFHLDIGYPLWLVRLVTFTRFGYVGSVAGLVIYGVVYAVYTLLVGCGWLVCGCCCCLVVVGYVVHTVGCYVIPHSGWTLLWFAHVVGSIYGCLHVGLVSCRSTWFYPHTRVVPRCSFAFTGSLVAGYVGSGRYRLAGLLLRFGCCLHTRLRLVGCTVTFALHARLVTLPTGSARLRLRSGLRLRWLVVPPHTRFTPRLLRLFLRFMLQRCTHTGAHTFGWFMRTLRFYTHTFGSCHSGLRFGYRYTRCATVALLVVYHTHGYTRTLALHTFRFLRLVGRLVLDVTFCSQLDALLHTHALVTCVCSVVYTVCGCVGCCCTWLLLVWLRLVYGTVGFFTFCVVTVLLHTHGCTVHVLLVSHTFAVAVAHGLLHTVG